MGLDFYGITAFRSPTSEIRDINYLEMSNTIVDEIEVRERTDFIATGEKNTWQVDTRMKATMINTLEAGNTQNDGVPITQFVVKRREIDRLDSITLTYLPFVNDSEFYFIDYLQGNREYVYSVVPIGSNGMEGKPNNVSITSDFVGYHIVDKTDLTNILTFDKFMDSGSPMVSLQLNQGRTEIKTLSKYPTVFYDDSSYHSFTLESVFLPEEFARSNKTYEKILKMVNKHEPVLIKASDGGVFVCDISNPRKSGLQNSFKGYDYFTLQIDAMEIMDEKTYIEG
jgi:hypothetical protein